MLTKTLLHSPSFGRRSYRYVPYMGIHFLLQNVDRRSVQLRLLQFNDQNGQEEFHIGHERV
jgi:hypothetical protein